MDSNEQRDAIVKAMIANTANSVAQKPGYQESDLNPQIVAGNPATIGQKSGDATPPRYSLDPGSGSNFPERGGRQPASTAWAEVAPGVSLASFQNYNWQNDPGNRSLLNTTTNYPMVPGPYSIGGLAANSFGTDPYANAADPRLSGHVTPYGGSGPPAPGYWADLAGNTGVPGQPSIYQPGQATSAPALPPIPTPASANGLYPGLV
jgi:hypothetical protein